MRIVLFGQAFVTAAAFATTYAPPDTRSWEQVTADFQAREARSATDGMDDGRRLKQLDSTKAAAFLIPFLAKDQPDGLRVKAINALGWAALHEAIPALSAIALDTTDSERIRGEALNPGLRYMKHGDAVKTASALAADESRHIRSGAYWVLSNHGTDEAVEILAARLRANDKPLLDQLIFALTFSNHERAGRIVFDAVDFSALPHDEEHIYAYARAMEQYRVPEAQQNMLSIAQQPPRPLSCMYALRYFSSFPREDVARVLIAYIDAGRSAGDLYDTVTEFIKSPGIATESKLALSAFIDSGKVRKKGKRRL